MNTCETCGAIGGYHHPACLPLIREHTAGVLRARLHARVLPISSTRGAVPLCAHECGRHVPYARIGEPCRYCVEAEKTRNR